MSGKQLLNWAAAKATEEQAIALLGDTEFSVNGQPMTLQEMSERGVALSDVQSFGNGKTAEQISREAVGQRQAIQEKDSLTGGSAKVTEGQAGAATKQGETQTGSGAPGASRAEQDVNQSGRPQAGSMGTGPGSMGTGVKK